MNLIKSSKKNINMTMDLKEEIEKPLPKIYHNTLSKLAKKSIIITRYGFGSKQLFNNFKNKYKEVIMYYGGSLNKYQRMLIVDEKQGLFVVNGIVFFSRFKPLIKSLLKYVKIYK